MNKPHKMPTLIEIYNEARQDPRAIITTFHNGESIINKGCKIQKFSDRIEILNMGKGGDYFKVCTEDEYNFFFSTWLEIRSIAFSIKQLHV